MICEWDFGLLIYRLSYDKYNPKHEELWNYCIKWHLDMLDKFNETFNHRIKEFEKRNDFL